jgi:hypothetical protein
MAIRVFTVIRGEIKPGMCINRCISASGEIVFAIVIGRDRDNPGFLPIKGLRARDQDESGATIEIQMVELDAETLELTACTDGAEVDDEHVLVVFSAESQGDVYYYGGTKAESGSGINGHVRPLNPRAYSPTHPQAHLVQLLAKGDIVTAHGTYNNTIHAESFCWDGDRLLPQRNSFAAF